MQKKILVTGAAGFIGFHLSRLLKKRGDIVIGLDNFNAYYSPELKRKRAEILASEGITVIEGDLCDKELLQRVAEQQEFTHIVNLAAQAGVRYSVTHPQAYADSNLQGFLNVLELCRSLPQAKLVYASSSSVYGLNSKIPFSEDDKTDRPASFYGATKKANEVMAHAYHHLYGIPVTGLRFFTVYGPWGRPDMAYFSFSKAIDSGEVIKVFNHGKMRRDFTYIDDIVEGIAAAIDLGADCEVFNLGNNRPEELSTFIGLLEKGLGLTARKEFLPMQQGDVLQTYANIDRAKTRLGYNPKTSLTEGLDHFIHWYKEMGEFFKAYA